MLIKRLAGFYFNWLSQQIECLIASFPKWEKKNQIIIFLSYNKLAKYNV